MRAFFAIAAAAAALAAGPALSQPSPNEERGMHVGDANTNGVATIVTDRNGTHPEGYPGFSPINHAAGDSGRQPREIRPHHRHHRAAEEYR